MADVAGFFNQVAAKVDKSKIGSMSAVYQFNISGDGGGEWNVKVGGGNVEVGTGRAENPNITLTMDAGNFVDLVSGKLNAQTAFLTGKLKIQGDMTLAMKLQSILALG